MNASPADSTPEPNRAPRTGLNPLAMAVFAVALLIGGLLIWLSFAGGTPVAGEIVVALETPGGDAESETLLSDGGAAIVAMPGGDGGTQASTSDRDGIANREDDGSGEYTPDGSLQKVGSLPLLPPGAPLRRAPITGLYEESPTGLLPVIAADGRRAVASYARPFAPAGTDARPRVAVMIMGFGLNRTFAERAIEQLPPDISVAYTPYAGDLQEQINAARADGHEVALELPMEPFDYPDNDPGPYTLLTSLPQDANRKRLEWLLARATGYFATVNRQGGRYLSESDALAPTLIALRARGLGFIDTGDGARNITAKVVPGADFDWAEAQQVIDAAKSPRQIDRALAALEAAARKNGLALGIGTALPVTVERVAEWAQSLDGKGIDLVPVSAVLAAGVKSAEPGDGR